MQISSGPLARTEVLSFQLQLNKVLAERYREHLKVLPIDAESLMENMLSEDLLKVNYKVGISYFGNVAQCLSSIITIFGDEEVVVTAELEELVHGESVIVEVIDRLRAIQEIIRKRSA